MLIKLVEKYGTFGFGELGECGEEGIFDYTGAGTDKQGQVVNRTFTNEFIVKNITSRPL